MPALAPPESPLLGVPVVIGSGDEVVEAAEEATEDVIKPVWDVVVVAELVFDVTDEVLDALEVFEVDFVADEDEDEDEDGFKIICPVLLR
jgi:hypothetical protein